MTKAIFMALLQNRKSQPASKLDGPGAQAVRNPGPPLCVLGRDLLEPGDALAEPLHVPAEMPDLFRRPGVDVAAYRPYAGGHAAEPPQLLRNPQQAARVHVRQHRVTVADPPDAALRQNLQRDFVERVRRRHPHPRLDALLRKDRRRAPYLAELPAAAQARKFAIAIAANDAGLDGDVYVLIAVQAHGPALALPAPCLLPEIRPCRRHVQVGVAVIGHNRHQRTHTVGVQHAFDFAPYRPVHAWTDIVEAQQIFGGRYQFHFLRSSSRIATRAPSAAAPIRLFERSALYW